MRTYLRNVVFGVGVTCFHLLAQPAPSITPGGAVNAASYAAGAPLVRGSIVSLFGNFQLTAPASPQGTPLPVMLSGLSVQFAGLNAPLFYVSPGQVNVQVPWELPAASPAAITATLNGQISAAQSVTLAPFSPGIFSMNAQGSGQGAITDASNRIVDSANPATPGVTSVQIFCTGLGAVTHQPPSGVPGPAPPLAETLAIPTVTIGGVPATVTFSGLAPGFVGEYQVNALVPLGIAASNSVPVTISIEGAVSNTVTIAVGPPAAAQPVVSPAGGISLNNQAIPLVFTWNTPLKVQGSGWKPGEIVSMGLHGPLNWPQASGAADLGLGFLTASATGAIDGSVTIPYDSGVVGLQARIPKPGVYQLTAAGSLSGAVAAVATINLTVATALAPGSPIDWGTERGGRVGVFPGTLADRSPERFDPEWSAVWRDVPVSAYGTLVPNGSKGPNQPAIISPSDNPITHYGHDANFFFTPDAPYQWLVGTENYRAYAPPAVSTAPDIIEIEWETLNAGSTAAYDRGNIGLPVWANPTEGDRLFVVGRWVLDLGHPDEGARTEIHPPRLMATMRHLPAAAAGSGSRAAHVDIYVSGHGGGANQNDPPGLNNLLDQQGYGGGRIKDVLSAADQQIYYRGGPAPAPLATIAAVLVEQLSGLKLTGPIESTAGPSAFSWGAPGAEEHPINDMNYDFDVLLPPPPPGATAIQVQVITRPQHTTAVNEVVTYGNLVNGLPTVAHVHLPYLGADNGIYARSLQFAWNQPSSPGAHFRVQISGIQVTDDAGTWHMWSDVSGQWTYLSGLAPGLLTTVAGKTVSIPGVAYDVYLQSADTIRVFVDGYSAMCLDSQFGKLFGQSSYAAGLTLIATCGLSDNIDLGGALLILPAAQSSAGQYTVAATDGNQPAQSHFKIQVNVEFVK